MFRQAVFHMMFCSGGVAKADIGGGRANFLCVAFRTNAPETVYGAAPILARSSLQDCRKVCHSVMPGHVSPGKHVHYFQLS